MLSQRTHPDMKLTTSSGFVLRGYKVLTDPAAPTGVHTLPAPAVAPLAEAPASALVLGKRPADEAAAAAAPVAEVEMPDTEAAAEGGGKRAHTE
jgi:hypothetical protein